jgi:hypothetical protein
MNHTTTLMTRVDMTRIDDERRAPMGLTIREQCPECHGPLGRTDLSGLCWTCMPCA